MVLCSNIVNISILDLGGCLGLGSDQYRFRMVIKYTVQIWYKYGTVLYKPVQMQYLPVDIICIRIIPGINTLYCPMHTNIATVPNFYYLSVYMC